MVELDNSVTLTKAELDSTQAEKEALMTELNSQINNLKYEIEQLKDEKDSEIKILTDKVHSQERNFSKELIQKDEVIAQAETNIEELTVQLKDLQKAMAKEKEDMDNLLLEKAKDQQVRSYTMLRVTLVCNFTPLHTCVVLGEG